MRKRIFGFLFAPVAVLGAVAIVAACGDDDDIVPGTDSGSNDSQVGPDGKGDGAIPDGGPKPDVVVTDQDSGPKYVPNPVMLAEFNSCRGPAGNTCAISTLKEGGVWEHAEQVAVLPVPGDFGRPLTAFVSRGFVAEVFDGGYGPFAMKAIAPAPSPPNRSVGLAVDSANQAYLAMGTFAPDGGPGGGANPIKGIYRALGDGGMVLVSQAPPVPWGWLSALDFIGNDLFIGDALWGRILKMAPDGTVTVWKENDPLLAGNMDACAAQTTGAPRAFGVYAMTHDANNVYIGNHDKGAIVKIPINGDGSAGTSVAVVPGLTVNDTDCQYQGMKGLVRDTDGTFYFSAGFANKIYHASADFSKLDIFVEGTPPWEQPGGLAIDVNPATNKRRLLVVNTSIAAHKAWADTDGAAAEPNPSVWAIELP